MNKIIPFEKDINRYIKLATCRIENKDYLGALSMLFDGERICKNYEFYEKIAKVYSLMEQYEMSNLYWFRYLYYAPKEKASTCYEELAINYFYLDNLWASGYYFHKKISVDGFVSRKDIDPEIIDFFSGEEAKKYAFRIVYPYDKADYSLELTNAKRFIRAGSFKESIVELEKVPKPCLDEQALDDLSVAYLMLDDYKNAEKSARECINRFGDNLNAYCNLSTIFDMQKDSENAEFYYQKALSLYDDKTDDNYKIVGCAIERKDHFIANKCFEKILIDRPYDFTMRFFYALSLINLGDYQKGLEELKKSYLHNPKDFVIEYYINLTKKLLDGSETESKTLPLPYYKELPKKCQTAYKKKIGELARNPQNVSTQIKKKETKQMLTWGLIFGKDALMKECAMILSFCDKKVFKEIALNVMLNPDVNADAKRLLVYALCVSGVRGKLALVVGSYYCEFSLKKLLCEKHEGSRPYISAYALCLSRILLYGIDDFTNVVNATDRLFFDIGNQVSSDEVTNEELAGLILAESGYENFSNAKFILSVFDVEEAKLQKLINIAEKAKKERDNDKNNRR